MSPSFPIRRKIRATRISLQGRIVVTIELENGRFLTGKLQQLSVTGGLLEVPMYVEERSKVGLALPIGATTLRPQAEMLFPMWGALGYLQPFRLTRLWAEERLILETEINEVLKQSVARSSTGHGDAFRPPRLYLESL
jgi:hypothetical protein